MGEEGGDPRGKIAEWIMGLIGPTWNRWAADSSRAGYGVGSQIGGYIGQTLRQLRDSDQGDPADAWPFGARPGRGRGMASPTRYPIPEGPGSGRPKIMRSYAHRAPPPRSLASARTARFIRSVPSARPRVPSRIGRGPSKYGG